MSDYYAYRILASAPLTHAFLLVLYAMMRWYDDAPEYSLFGLWWVWPVALFLFYRNERWRWMLPGAAGGIFWSGALIAVLR